jgi:hypothetical protein
MGCRVCFPIQTLNTYPVSRIGFCLLALFLLGKHSLDVFSHVLAEDLEHVVLVCCCIAGYFGGEGEGDDAGDAGAKFEDCGGGAEERGGEEEVCGGGEPGGEEGGDLPYYCWWSVSQIEGQDM